MSSGAPITACIISFQERDRIEDCLRSLDFCDEVLVVDSHSTDGTAELAEAAGARVIRRDWPGYGEQKRFAVEAATHDWVLCLDCDERLSDTARAEIAALDLGSDGGPAGYELPRRTAYLGAWIGHGGWYPDRQLRLFDRRRGAWTPAKVHEKVELQGELGRLQGDLLHLAYRSWTEHLTTIDKYTTLMAEGMHARGKRAGLLDLFTHPAARFLRFFVLRAGFRDGWRGLVIAKTAAWYAFLKYAKLMALQRAGELGPAPAGSRGRSSTPEPGPGDPPSA